MDYYQRGITLLKLEDIMNYQDHQKQLLSDWKVNLSLHLPHAVTTFLSSPAGITTVNGSLLSVNDDLSTQLVQVNCYTFRIEPEEITWMIDPDSNFQPVNGSMLLDSTDQTYRHYITLTGSFTDGTIVSCNVNVNDNNINKGYTLKGKYMYSLCNCN